MSIKVFSRVLDWKGYVKEVNISRKVFSRILEEWKGACKEGKTFLLRWTMGKRDNPAWGRGKGRTSASFVFIQMNVV